MRELVHSWSVKEVVHFNLISKANMYNITTVIVTKMFYMYKHYFSLVRKLFFILNLGTLGFVLYI